MSFPPRTLRAVALVHTDSGARLPDVTAVVRRADDPEQTWAVEIEPLDDHGLILAPVDPLRADTEFVFSIQTGEQTREFTFTTTGEFHLEAPELSELSPKRSSTGRWRCRRCCW